MKIKKNIIREFDCNIYPRKIWIAIGCETSCLRDLFEDEIKEFDSDNAYVLSTRRIKPDVKGGVLIRFENKKVMTPDVIAHEATHAAIKIFDYVDAKLTVDNQEPFAYFVGWIVKIIYSCLKSQVESDRVFNYTIYK